MSKAQKAGWARGARCLLAGRRLEGLLDLDLPGVDYKGPVVRTRGSELMCGGLLPGQGAAPAFSQWGIDRIFYSWRGCRGDKQA